MLDTEVGVEVPNRNAPLSPPISIEPSKKCLYACILQLQQNTKYESLAITFDS